MPAKRSLMIETATWLLLLAVGSFSTAQSGSFQGVTPGLSRANLLVQSPQWGRPQEQQIIDPQWRLWVYQKSGVGRIEVLLHGDVVQTIDVMPQQPLSPRDAVRAFGLVDLVPAHRLPADALVGPFLPRTWSFQRTLADAIIFSEDSETESRVKLIRVSSGPPPLPNAVDRQRCDRPPSRYGWESTCARSRPNWHRASVCHPDRVC